MSMDVQVEGLDEVNELVTSLPQWAFKGAKKALADYVLSVDKTTKERLSGVDLQVRSGFLRRSFNFTVKGDSLSTLGASNFTDAKYAPIHQMGGTISAKNKYLGVPGGPYLNIPSRDNQTPAGVTRMSAYQVFQEGGYIVPIRSPRARYAVMLAGRAMYWLVKSVKIPKRMQFIETAEKGIPTLLSTMAESVVTAGREV